jgi:4-hydroxyphenylacetate 3-monooxygenase
MLATAAPLAQELLVAAVQPLRPGEERYSFTAMVPLNAKGLKLFSRRSYEQAAPSEFDYPLSSRFDESDCIVYFDEVKIPWERVFIHNDIKMAQAQWFQTPVMVYQNYPAQIRLTVKLRFLLGLAYRLAEANGIAQFPAVQETLGQLAAEVNMVEGMVRAMEVNGKQYGPYFIPDPSLQYSAMVLTQQLYNGVTARIRELAGGGLIATPSSERDLADPSIMSYIEKIHGSEALDAVGRVKLFKLGWDALGSEFATRHAQYEMFYAGPTIGNRLRNFRSYDWDRSTNLVDEFLATIKAPQVNAPAP